MCENQYGQLAGGIGGRRDTWVLGVWLLGRGRGLGHAGCLRAIVGTLPVLEPPPINTVLPVLSRVCREEC